MSTWLSAAERQKTDPAERAAFPSPVPTQIISNGEYSPAPQTRAQRAVERTLESLAEQLGAKLGLSRREFFGTACGMAAAFLAMNRVYGPLFAVTAAEAADPVAAKERLAGLADQFIFDVQNHFIRDDFHWDGILALGEYAKRWNPVLAEEGISFRRYKFENYLKEVFLDSDTKLALVSGAPSDDPKNTVLPSDDIARARAIVNGLAGSRRLFAHAIIAPGRPGWLEEMDRAIETLKPDSWKGYTVGDPLSPSKWPWRLDDEKVAYRGYEKMRKSGIRIVCIHKGLIPADYEKSFPTWRHAMVDDVGRAAKDWPDLTFVIYHAGLKPFLTPPDESLAQFEKTGRMDWVTDLAEIPSKYRVHNVYAEIGTSFASSCVTHPRHCAAMMGTLVRGLGVERVLWGTDSVWYGSPQWQIEALRRLEIPADIQEKHGFEPLGAADGPVKSAIFGKNAARLYGLERQAARSEPLESDGIAAVKRDYQAAGGARSNAYFGWIRRRT